MGNELTSRSACLPLLLSANSLERTNANAKQVRASVDHIRKQEAWTRDVRGQYGYSADVQKSARNERYYLFEPISPGLAEKNRGCKHMRCALTRSDSCTVVPNKPEAVCRTPAAKSKASASLSVDDRL